MVASVRSFKRRSASCQRFFDRTFGSDDHEMRVGERDRSLAILIGFVRKEQIRAVRRVLLLRAASDERL